MVHSFLSAFLCKALCCSRRVSHSGHPCAEMVHPMNTVCYGYLYYFKYTDNPSALSQSFVENAVQLLVTCFIPLNASDLEGWMNDPEEWINVEDQENDQWEYQ